VDGSSSNAHAYAECSNKGLCNRESGECECFAEYEGAACERSACPNDCSGHGKCEYIHELSTVAASAWEYEKIQGCRCDGGFFGKDCSQRLCPRGDDPVTIKDHSDSSIALTAAELKPIGETYKITFTFLAGHAAAFNWHLEIDDMWNNTERSRPIQVPASLFPITSSSSYLDPSESGTEQLLWDFVRVLLDMDAISELDFSDLSTFTNAKVGIRLQHDDPSASFDTATYKFTLAKPLRVRAVRVRFNNECTVAGCYPKMPFNTYPAENAALAGQPGGVYIDAQLNRYAVPKAVVEVDTQAFIRHESEQCANRGICDYSTGLCNCFEGFYGNSCEKQTILV